MEHELNTSEVQMKDYFSKDFRRLIYGLLEKSIDNRITLDEVMREPFFKKIDWDKLEDKNDIKPPIKPNKINSMKVTKENKMIMRDECVPTPTGFLNRQLTARKTDADDKLKMFRKFTFI